MVSEERLVSTRQFSNFSAWAGATFAMLGVLMLYFYVWESFGSWSERLQWWAVISIVLSIIFILGYIIAADMVRNMEREQRRKLSER